MCHWFELRYVNGNGDIRWNRDWVNVSTVCIGEYVGLEEIDNVIWNVYFGPLKLGRLNERLTPCARKTRPREMQSRPVLCIPQQRHFQRIRGSTQSAVIVDVFTDERTT